MMYQKFAIKKCRAAGSTWEKRKEKIDRQTDSLPLALSSAFPKLKPTDKHHDRPYYILASRWSFVRSG